MQWGKSDFWGENSDGCMGYIQITHANKMSSHGTLKFPTTLINTEHLDPWMCVCVIYIVLDTTLMEPMDIWL